MTVSHFGSCIVCHISSQESENTMEDLLKLVAFLIMVLSPCLVAMSTGIHVGADLGIRDRPFSDELSENS